MNQGTVLSFTGGMVFALAAVAGFAFFADRSPVRHDPGGACPEKRLDYRVAAFNDLPGWTDDSPEQAFAAFLKSCTVFLSQSGELPAVSSGVKQISAGTVADWQKPCMAARDFPDRPAAPAIRAFFESYFRPVQPVLHCTGTAYAGTIPEESGIFTGYFEPVYPASKVRNALHRAPVYPRPPDLVDLDPGIFRKEWTGMQTAGRIEGSRLVPYPSRLEIDNGALAGSVRPLAWMDENDLFFLQIQGSGRLVFTDGTIAAIRYAGRNGHRYTPVGRILLERGLITRQNMSMQSIRSWLENAAPEEARALRSENASYIFFSMEENPAPESGPVGAGSVPLTAGRSLAVDRSFYPLGAPVFVDIKESGSLHPPVRRLMIAQDTGAAIRGPLRGDVYWGSGNDAGRIAGTMNTTGRMFVLFPETVATRLQSR